MSLFLIVASVCLVAVAIYWTVVTSPGKPAGLTNRSMQMFTIQKARPPMSKSEEEWKKQLTPEQYHVTRQKGTERAFTGKYWNNHESGKYACVCCGAELFGSDTKFESGSGWPSFYQPTEPEAIAERSDNTLGMNRVEISCAKCGAHLGHVFDDGPRPTGLRYCVNSASLDFRKSDSTSMESAADSSK